MIIDGELTRFYCIFNTKILNEGHSKIRLFVTHGGLYSLQEAIFHSTPVIGIPVGNDQGQNLARAEKEGYAKVLTWEELDENTLGSAINEVLYNES